MTIRRPTAHIWSLPEMLQHLIYVRDGRKVLGQQLLSTADFRGLTAASRMLVDDDKEGPVAALWLTEPGRISVETAKDAWALRDMMWGCPPWIEFRVEEEDDEL
jgi:hypothetical protein